MPKPTKEAAEERDEDLDALMAETFGTTADDEYLGDEEDLDLDEEPQADEPEGDEDEDEEDEPAFADEDELDDEDEDEEDDPDDDLEDSDDDEDEPGESAPAGTQDAGDGADDVPSDGMLALDMMADQTLAGFVAPSDDFDPEVVGTLDEYKEDAREAFGEDYDQKHIDKMATANYKTAVRTAKKRHEATAKDRAAERAAQNTARLTAEIHEIGRVAPDELSRVDSAMARIYQEKVDKYGEVAAASLSAEVYFRLAGGKLGVPGKKAKNRSGVASRKAKVQKAGAVRQQQNPDQVGRVRTGKKKRRTTTQVLLEETNSHLKRRRAADFLFGEDS